MSEVSEIVHHELKSATVRLAAMEVPSEEIEQILSEVIGILEMWSKLDEDTTKAPHGTLRAAIQEALETVLAEHGYGRLY